MTKEYIIERVKARLEEISPFDEPGNFIASGDGSLVKPVTSYIEDLLEVSNKDMLLSLPLHLLRNDVKLLLPKHETDKNGVVSFDVPEDFLRFCSIKMKCWDREVDSICRPGSALYQLQKNKYTRGGIYKPVAAIVTKNGKNVFECYTVEYDGNEPVEYFYYLPERLLEQVQSDIQEYVVLRCTALVCSVFGLEKYVEQFTNELNERISIQI